MSLARGSLSENRRVSANGENGIDSLPPSQLNRKDTPALTLQNADSPRNLTVVASFAARRSQ
jgi:hypothetical protein